MWSTVEHGQLNVDNLRHAVNQKDGMERYGWQSYDIRKGGLQKIIDTQNEMEMQIDFSKFDDEANAGNWGLRVTGAVKDAWSRPRNVSVIVAITLEEDIQQGAAFVDCERNPPNSMSIQCKGIGPGLGVFLLDLPAPESIKDHKTSLIGLNVKDDLLWQTKSK